MGTPVNVVFEQVRELANTDPETRTLVVESSALAREIEEIKALCDIVYDLDQPPSGSSTTTVYDLDQPPSGSFTTT